MEILIDGFPVSPSPPIYFFVENYVEFSCINLGTQHTSTKLSKSLKQFLKLAHAFPKLAGSTRTCFKVAVSVIDLEGPETYRYWCID